MAHELRKTQSLGDIMNQSQNQKQIETDDAKGLSKVSRRTGSLYQKPEGSQRSLRPRPKTISDCPPEFARNLVKSGMDGGGGINSVR